MLNLITLCINLKKSGIIAVVLILELFSIFLIFLIYVLIEKYLLVSVRISKNCNSKTEILKSC